MDKRVAGWNRCVSATDKEFYKVDGQTVAEKTVGTVDSIGTSLNNLYANTYGRLNLDACAPLLKVEI
jgi:hypothetical protein